MLLPSSQIGDIFTKALLRRSVSLLSNNLDTIDVYAPVEGNIREVIYVISYVFYIYK